MVIIVLSDQEDQSWLYICAWFLYGVTCSRYQIILFELQWHHNEHNCIPNHWCLNLFTQPFGQVQIKENIKAPRHWLLWGELTGDKWIPHQSTSNMENVSIWWRHHDKKFHLPGEILYDFISTQQANNIMFPEQEIKNHYIVP